MIRMMPALEGANLKAKMLLQVHDELVFEVPKSEVAKTTDVVKQVMENAARPAADLSVPLIVEAGQGMNWDEAH